MFSKTNLKQILILALGFFWCSSVYLTQSTALSLCSNQDYSNVIAVVFGNLSMALGIFLFSLIYRKVNNIKKYYILSLLFSLISLVIFIGTKNVIIMSFCLCLTALFGTSGFCGGYHFALVASNVEKEYRGRVFALGYAIGSIFAYIISLLPNNIYATYISLFIYIPVILVNLYLVIKQKELEIIEKEKYTTNFKKYFAVIVVITVFMAFLSAISADVIAIYSFDMNGVFTNSRIYYSIGLIIAGILCDKRKELFDMLTLSSFIFYLISIVLLNQNIPSGIIVAISFLFLGFFVIFRTITFMNISNNKKNMLFMSSYGLMYSRIVEGTLSIFEKSILEHYLVLILLEAVVLCALLLVYVLLYMKNNSINENDKVKEISLKYKLSIQEEKVLNLLMQDLSNKEIADKLYLSIYTIKNHVSNIYKKTKMNKRELREKCQQKDY